MGGTTWFSGIKFMQIKGCQNFVDVYFSDPLHCFLDGMDGNEEKPGWKSKKKGIW